MNTTQDHCRYSALFRICRPYFDLGAATDENPLHSIEIEIAWRRLCGHFEGRPGALMGMTHRYRALLVDAFRDTRYSAIDPETLEPNLRTHRWRAMCMAVQNFESMSPAERISLGRLLNSLGYYRKTSELLSRQPEIYKGIARSERAHLLAVSEFNFGGQLASANLLKAAIGDSEGTALQRFKIACSLALVYTNIISDKREARAWLSSAKNTMSKDLHDLLPADLKRMQAYFHLTSIRVFGSDTAQTILQKATECYQELTEFDERDRFERQVLYEAQRRLGDDIAQCFVQQGAFDRAFRFLNSAVLIDPTDPKARWLRADVRLATGDTKGALDDYIVAAAMGPIGHARAWFYAGYCEELIGNCGKALEYYQASLFCDQTSSSSVAGRGTADREDAWRRLRISSVGSKQNEQTVSHARRQPTKALHFAPGRRVWTLNALRPSTLFQ